MSTDDSGHPKGYAFVEFDDEVGQSIIADIWYSTLSPGGRPTGTPSEQL